jgi:hypothetical protein
MVDGGRAQPPWNASIAVVAKDRANVANVFGENQWISDEREQYCTESMP